MNAKCTLLHWLFHTIVGDLNFISKAGFLAHFIFLLWHSIILNLYETKNYVSYKHISTVMNLTELFFSDQKGFQNYVLLLFFKLCIMVVVLNAELSCFW